MARMKNGKQRAGAAVAAQILDDCNQYSVPDDGEHALKDSGRVEQRGDEFAVTWSAVHALFQFFGCWPDGSHQIRHHTPGYTMNPSIQWTEPARARYGKDWNTVARRAYVRGGGR